MNTVAAGRASFLGKTGNVSRKYWGWLIMNPLDDFLGSAHLLGAGMEQADDWVPLLERAP